MDLGQTSPPTCITCPTGTTLYNSICLSCPAGQYLSDSGDCVGNKSVCKGSLSLFYY